MATVGHFKISPQVCTIHNSRLFPEACFRGQAPHWKSSTLGLWRIERRLQCRLDLVSWHAPSLQLEFLCRRFLERPAAVRVKSGRRSSLRGQSARPEGQRRAEELRLLEPRGRRDPQFCTPARVASGAVRFCAGPSFFKARASFGTMHLPAPVHTGVHDSSAQCGGACRARMEGSGHSLP